MTNPLTFLMSCCGLCNICSTGARNARDLSGRGYNTIAGLLNCGQNAFLFLFPPIVNADVFIAQINQAVNKEGLCSFRQLTGLLSATMHVVFWAILLLQTNTMAEQLSSETTKVGSGDAAVKLTQVTFEETMVAIRPHAWVNASAIEAFSAGPSTANYNIDEKAYIWYRMCQVSATCGVIYDEHPIVYAAIISKICVWVAFSLLIAWILLYLLNNCGGEATPLVDSNFAILYVKPLPPATIVVVGLIASLSVSAAASAGISMYYMLVGEPKGIDPSTGALVTLNYRNQGGAEPQYLSPVWSVANGSMSAFGIAVALIIIIRTNIEQAYEYMQLKELASATDQQEKSQALLKDDLTKSLIEEQRAAEQRARTERARSGSGAAV